jgi:hypothetical protein
MYATVAQGGEADEMIRIVKELLRHWLSMAMTPPRYVSGGMSSIYSLSQTERGMRNTAPAVALQLWGLLQYVMSDPESDLAPAKRKQFEIGIAKPFNTPPKLPSDPKQDLRSNLHLPSLHRGKIVLTGASAFGKLRPRHGTF